MSFFDEPGDPAMPPPEHPNAALIMRIRALGGEILDHNDRATLEELYERLMAEQVRATPSPEPKSDVADLLTTPTARAIVWTLATFLHVALARRAHLRGQRKREIYWTTCIGYDTAKLEAVVVELGEAHRKANAYKNHEPRRSMR